VPHAAGECFLCRHCCDLRYESQREDKTHRALRRAQKIRKRLSGSASMTEPFPEKPKGGWTYKTYTRMFWEAPRGRDGATGWHEGVARQAIYKELRQLDGRFVRHFLRLEL
jgi:hypothetical protein